MSENLAYPHDQRIALVLQGLTREQLLALYNQIVPEDMRLRHFKTHSAAVARTAEAFATRYDRMVDLAALTRGELLSPEISDEPVSGQTLVEQEQPGHFPRVEGSFGALEDGLNALCGPDKPRKRGRPRKHPFIPHDPDKPRKRGRPRGVKKGGGIIAEMFRLLSVEALTVPELVERLAATFPERNPGGIANTVRIQLKRYPQKHGGLVIASNDDPPRYRYDATRVTWAEDVFDVEAETEDTATETND